MTDATRVDMARALVLSGILLYIPANILPVMTMTVTGEVEALTVLGGVEELYDSGLWPVAAIVFLASIVVPFLKLTCMTWILFLHSTAHHQRLRTKMFRIIRQIGTWSMVDIFLLAVLTAVGQLGVLASVRAEIGGVFFTVVLLCSLFAADIYKPELIWRSARVPAIP